MLAPCAQTRRHRRPRPSRDRPGSARPRSAERLTAAAAGARPLLRLRPAQQRADAALRRSSGTAATREAGLTDDRRPGSPRFPFGADPEAVAAGLERLGVEFPVAIDAERALWHAYGCEGWPSLFLWGAAARCAGSTSARASTTRPRRRSRPSCASGEGHATCRSRWRRSGARPTPPARSRRPQRRALPRRLARTGPGPRRGRRALIVEYEAGGAYATARRHRRRSTVDLDGGADEVDRDRRPGPLPAREHARHGRHAVASSSAARSGLVGLVRARCRSADARRAALEPAQAPLTGQPRARRGSPSAA